MKLLPNGPRDNPLVTAAQALLAATCLLLVAAGNLALAPVWLVARAAHRGRGWIVDKETTGGEHDRASRPRKASVDPLPKRRWWAAWSDALRGRP